jgi:hypothetical protein
VNVTRIGKYVIQQNSADAKLLAGCHPGGKKRATENKKKAELIGHILHGNCLLNHVTEGKIGDRMEVRGR